MTKTGRGRERDGKGRFRKAPTKATGAPSGPIPPDPGPGYKVGPGRPPKHTQFKPGQSGHPEGMPPGIRSLTKILREQVEGESVTIKVDGKAVTVATEEALIKAAIRKAISGDFRFWKEIYDRLDGPIQQRIALEAFRSAESEAGTEEELQERKRKLLEGRTLEDGG